jgi:hypothetical protein
MDVIVVVVEVVFTIGLIEDRWIAAIPAPPRRGGGWPQSRHVDHNGCKSGTTHAAEKDVVKESSSS